MGGIDPAGSHVIQIHPYGSTANLPYTTMGSGSLAAMSVLEDSWQPGMNEEQVSSSDLLPDIYEIFQAKKCVRDAIASGILSDGYSGSQVDLVVITKDKTDYLRAYDVVCDKGDRIGKYGFKPGTTPVVHQKVFLFQKTERQPQAFFRLKSLLKSLKKLLKRWNHNYPEISTFLWRKYPLWMISCNRKIFMNLYYALFIGLTENARLHVFHMLLIKCLE